MAKFTLFEIHLDDSTLTTNAPFSGESESAGSEAGDGPAADDADEGGSGLPVVPIAVGLVVLLVLVAVLRRLIGGSDEEIVDEPA